MAVRRSGFVVLWMLVLALALASTGWCFSLGGERVPLGKVAASPLDFINQIVTIDQGRVANVRKGEWTRWEYDLIGETGHTITVRTDEKAPPDDNVILKNVRGRVMVPDPANAPSFYLLETGGFPLLYVLIGVLVVLAGVLAWKIAWPPPVGKVDCPHCGAKVRADASLCPKCNQPIYETAQPPEPQMTRWHCPVCGASGTETGVNFCPQCRADLHQTAPPPPPPPDEAPIGSKGTEVVLPGELQIDTPTGPEYKVLSCNPTTIGRDPGNNIPLSHETVSSRHAHIRYDNEKDEFTLADFDSTNGTFVNGVKITKQVLEDGDEIRFGPYLRARFRKVKLG